jgi:RimJ/RimL family protein N-acetyltransferase
MAAVITTERLELVLLEPRVLRLIEAGTVAEVESVLGVEAPGEWAQTIPARERLAQVVADPLELPWLVRAMVSRATQSVVGSVGFHGPPDSQGRVEIGYDVLPEQRRRGYAREALLGLVGWAFATGEVRTCVASIAPQNTASRALVGSLAFCHVGEQVDEIDGLELLYERALPLDPLP